MTEPRVRVVIADDHPIFRSGLRQLLESEGSCEVVGEASDGEQTAEVVEATRPDVLLLDFAMPRSNGLDALRALDERGVTTRAVVLTADINSDQIVACLRLGAAGVLLKSAATELLFECIRSVMAGQYWVDRGTMRDLVSALRRYEIGPAGQQRAQVELTPREREIVTALARGESNKEIARGLGIAEQTVKNYLSQLFDKLGVSSRLELVVRARERDLLDS